MDPPCCWGNLAMAITFTPPPLAPGAAAAPPGPDDTVASLGASEGGDERTASWALSGSELRGRILGHCLMKASTCHTANLHVNHPPQEPMTRSTVGGANIRQASERRRRRRKEQEDHLLMKTWMLQLICPLVT